LTLVNLDDLIKQVKKTSLSEEPLDLVATAMGVKADLDDVTDSLIGHFVDQARRSGCSWSEIGAAMGMTKQAAQQRHTNERPRGRERSHGRSPMFARFTPRARMAVREADAAAAELGHDQLDTEHLLLGLLAVPRSIAGESLAAMGVTAKAVVAELEVGSVPRPRGRRRRVPFTALAKQTLERSMHEAAQLGHNHIGTEHVLLALLEVRDGAAATILTNAGVTHARALADITERLKAVS
jgi:hypothetical protein